MAGNADKPGRQFAAAWQAAAAALGEWRQRVAKATSEAVDKLDPAVRAAVEAGRAALSGDRHASRRTARRARPPPPRCPATGVPVVARAARHTLTTRAYVTAVPS